MIHYYELDEFDLTAYNENYKTKYKTFAKCNYYFY